MISALILVSLASPLAIILAAPRRKTVPVRVKARRDRVR